MAEMNANRSTPAALGETEIHDLDSDSVGDRFRIFVGHCGDEPRTTLVLPDANGLFGLAVDTVRLLQIPALVPSMLVVGIGYPHAAGILDTIQIRARDLTPTRTDVFEQGGGADAFLRFIADELGPWLGDRWPDATGESIYFGHSLGGLFGAYTFVTQPSVFDRYILSSPSLWWDRELVFRLDGVPAAPAASAYFGIGSLETDAGRRAEAANLPDGHPAKPPAVHLDMVDGMQRFVAHLRSWRNERVDVTAAVFDDEYHASVPALVLSRGLRHFFERRDDTDLRL